MKKILSVTAALSAILLIVSCSQPGSNNPNPVPNAPILPNQPGDPSSNPDPNDPSNPANPDPSGNPDPNDPSNPADPDPSGNPDPNDPSTPVNPPAQEKLGTLNISVTTQPEIPQSTGKKNIYQNHIYYYDIGTFIFINEDTVIIKNTIQWAGNDLSWIAKYSYNYNDCLLYIKPYGLKNYESDFHDVNDYKTGNFNMEDYKPLSYFKTQFENFTPDELIKVIYKKDASWSNSKIDCLQSIKEMDPETIITSSNSDMDIAREFARLYFQNKIANIYNNTYTMTFEANSCKLYPDTNAMKGLFSLPLANKKVFKSKDDNNVIDFYKYSQQLKEYVFCNLALNASSNPEKYLVKSITDDTINLININSKQKIQFKYEKINWYDLKITYQDKVYNLTPVDNYVDVNSF